MSGYLIPLRIVMLAALAFPAGAADAAKIDQAQIDQITGLKGTMNSDEGVYKVSAPRTDVQVTVDGVVMPPFMGLTSWAAFAQDPKEGAMVMGDLVLFEDEVEPVMSALLDSGLNVTALHNHFFYDSPKVFFMHIGGQGSSEKLATGVRSALDHVHAIRSAQPVPAHAFEHPALSSDKSNISAEPLQGIMSLKPVMKDGMVKFTIGRSVGMPCGCQVGKEMGVNTWAAFMGSDVAAVVDGDFVTAAGELQSVLKILRAGGINVVAIHNHMEDETPKMIFLHYWGFGGAQALATTVKSALDAQAKATLAPPMVSPSP